jgi:hypothetical protein
MRMPIPYLRRKVFPSLFSLSCLCACADKKDVSADLKLMEWSLNNSNKSIDVSTQTILKSLEEKKDDPATMERATNWYSKAEQMVKLSREFYTYSDSIKSILNKEGGFDESFIDRISGYKQAVLQIDTSIRDAFQNSPEFSFPLKESFTPNALAAFKNNIKIIENKIVAYCHMKVGNTGRDFDSYAPIVGQSSGYIGPGEILEITAGIGSYSKAVELTVIINGNTIDLAPEGFALYEMKVPKKPGKYQVPVKISYTDKVTDLQETKEVNIKYTVVKPCTEQ